MMQETGNNRTDSEKKKVLSIQLSLSGLYFSPSDMMPIDAHTTSAEIVDSIRGHMDAGGYDTLCAMLDTKQTVYVPFPLFKEELAEGYLRTNNLLWDDDQTVVVSQQAGNMVAVMPWKRAVIDSLREHFGENISFASPLQMNIISSPQKGITLRLSHKNAYITLYRAKLEYAEVLPWSTIADLIYYMESLDQTYNIRKEHLYLYGYNASDMAKQLGRYYKTRANAHNKW